MSYYRALAASYEGEVKITSIKAMQLDGCLIKRPHVVQRHRRESWLGRPGQGAAL